MPDLRRLIPTQESIEQAAEEGFEQTVIKSMARLFKVRIPADQRTIPFFIAETNFPFALEVQRMKTYRPEELFTRPTKTEPYKHWVETFGENSDEPSVLIFRAKGLALMAMTNSPIAVERARTYLRFKVRGNLPLFLAPLSDFAEGYLAYASPEKLET